MNRPESIEKRIYKGLVIEVELYRSAGGFLVWSYIEQSHTYGLTKRHFSLSEEQFPSPQAALNAAIVEGQRLIDNGLDWE